MPSISEKDRKHYLLRALKAADWFVNSQLGSYRPEWNADRGRFLYYYYIPGKKYVPGINWTQGRGLFVLSEAYRLTGRKPYLEAATWGARYVMALQAMDRRQKAVFGAIREETPQCSRSGALDAAQATSGLLMLERVTRNPGYLYRANCFCDYLLGHYQKHHEFVSSAHFYPKPYVATKTRFGETIIHNAVTIPLWHLYRRTRLKRYLPPVVDAADRILSYQQGDGSFLFLKKRGLSRLPAANHHLGIGRGKARLLVRNDDAMMTVVLAAWLASRKRKYLDSAVAYADWLTGNDPLGRPYCAFPVQANTVLDTGRACGRDYSGWVLDNLHKHLLRYQVLSQKDKTAEGGFRGEDEQGEGGIFGGRSLDYVTTRMTCYAAGTLFRLSGRGTGAGFSPWGLTARR
jgi:hypothetical protein